MLSIICVLSVSGSASDTAPRQHAREPDQDEGPAPRPAPAVGAGPNKQRERRTDPAQPGAEGAEPQPQ